MANPFPNSVRELLLARNSLVSLSKGDGGSGDDLVRAAELELAELGYVISDSLRHRLATCSPKELLDFLTWTVPVLLAKVGADRKHVPLFRNFPQGVPSDIEELWWRKVLVHFLQSDGQPCLFCGQVGTTHVCSLASMLFVATALTAQTTAHVRRANITSTCQVHSLLQHEFKNSQKKR